jgi:hypothetical protein
MLKFRFPTDQGNALARDGRLNQTVRSIVEELNPEAAYFTDMDGARGGYLVINMDDASQIPAMAEPLFLGLGATIELHAVMTPEDLEKADQAIEQAAKKYG